MKYFIITGTSRGLGEAMARQLLDEDHCLFCISRTENKVLLEEARCKQTSLYYITYDLNDVYGIGKIMEDIFDKIPINQVDEIYLINNAGMVAPIKPMKRCEDVEIIQNIHVNLIAPMILTSAFAKHVDRLNVKKRVLNISSGAGKKPYYGWSSYCSSKAGLDLFTQCSGLEEAQKEYPIETLSFAPGIIDTQMQSEIRESDKENFIQVERFIDFKESGVLLAPEKVAELIIELLLHQKWSEKRVVDIRECLDDSE